MLAPIGTQWVDRRLSPLHQDKPSSIGKPGGIYPAYIPIPAAGAVTATPWEHWVALLDAEAGEKRGGHDLGRAALVIPVLADLPEEKRPPLHSFLMQPDLGDLFTMVWVAHTHRLILAADSPFAGLGRHMDDYGKEGLEVAMVLAPARAFSGAGRRSFPRQCGDWPCPVSVPVACVRAASPCRLP